MEVFELIVDEKVKIWRRNYVRITANSLEEAIDKALDGDYDVEEGEYLYETSCPMIPSENDGYATVEVMDSSYNILKDNGQQF